MPKQSTDPLRKHLASLLDMEGAHIAFRDAVKDFPAHLRGAKPHGAPHSAWQLLEHIRIAQEDILDFSRNADYKGKKWPDDYWPKQDAPPNDAAWDKSIHQFEHDLKEMHALVGEAKHDLFEAIPHGKGQTLLREALLIADHNAYHLGQLVFLKKMLEARK